MQDCEKCRQLLMGLMDDELTSEESTVVNDHLIRCAACREEYEGLRVSCGKLERVSFVEPTDEVLRELWRSPYSSLARSAGLVLVLGGYAGLIGYGLYEFLTAGREALFVKVAVAAIPLGFGILLVSVIRERLRTYKVDPYKEVQR
ncbi:MAG: zf-HC2 domain-containing protein [Lentisphaerae bacterium]|jgi:hypothetical protein|nr:zf-HC2 domain-containing protein [Lentisphaerota bacterium]MBT4814099.1 zf-HC2 domain-containing protein [Lentisphaerota bacterium]MBT5604573.1 zf-HC2 domain-containing protein [Lentisphaerota bacterium]MBT7061746.1 zf-HC2 domain-containing protein [Lentisphaerota bacterium]MBT7848796.1 zf-HC2 domain-containing protein [Lentisphaerota bacterium]